VGGMGGIPGHLTGLAKGLPGNPSRKERKNTEKLTHTKKGKRGTKRKVGVFQQVGMPRLWWWWKKKGQTDPSKRGGETGGQVVKEPRVPQRPLGDVRRKKTQTL